MPIIPLDFVAGTHGHFLEYVLNRSLCFTSDTLPPFTSLGTSHQRSKNYLKNRQVVCKHWFETDPNFITNSDKVIRITFDRHDLLLVSSISLLRAADLKIDNNLLHLNTATKLKNIFYSDTLKQIYAAYPALDPTEDSIDRYILREFFKFGFRNPDINGYWKKLQTMISIPTKNAFTINFKKLYDLDQLTNVIHDIGRWLQRSVTCEPWLSGLHAAFISQIPFLHYQSQCDIIINAVINDIDYHIPALSLLQESYINGILENKFQKEMPFQQEKYFTNTKNVLYYIKHNAPNL